MTSEYRQWLADESFDLQPKTMMMISPPQTQTGTFGDFIKSRIRREMNAEQCEALGKEAYYLAEQILVISRLSHWAISSMPRPNSFELVNLFFWAAHMQGWLDRIGPKEYDLFAETVITWAEA